MDSVNRSEGRFKVVCVWCRSRMPTYHRTRGEAEETKRIHDGLVHRGSSATVIDTEATR